MMAKKLIVGNILAESIKIKQMWTQNPTFAVPDLTAAEHAAQEAALAAKENAVEALRAQLAGLIEERDGIARELNGWNVRIRRGVGFTFGLESPQYKMVGGTPPSERKPTTRKPKAPAP